MNAQQNEFGGNERSDSRPFKPNEHLMQIKNRNGYADYLPVQWRLVWFNEQCPEGKITIVEKIIDPEREVEKEVMQWNNETRRSEKVIKSARGWAYFHVRVEDGKGKVGEAVKSESAVDFDDYIEKADTGATGRALAKIGFGTQFAPEFDEQHRIVDAPVERAQAEVNGNGRKAIAAINKNNEIAQAPGLETRASNDARPPLAAASKERGQEARSAATDQQLASLRKLCQHLGRPEPDNMESMTHQSARELILQLSHEYNEQRQSSRKAS